VTDHTQISKDEWLALARIFYNQLLVEISITKNNEWMSDTRYLGWNCKDLVNHITSAITINFNFLIQLSLQGKPVPEYGFNLFLRNANEVVRRKDKTINEIINEFKVEFTKILNLFEGLSEEQWHLPAFFFIGDVDIKTLFLVQLADNVVHLRDLMMAKNKWKSFEPKIIDPLIDWFMVVFRPSFFRPEKASGKSALIQYNVIGSVKGNWFMKVENDTCKVFQGTVENPEIKITMTIEDLINSALARPSPFIGKLARLLQWIEKKERREDFTAHITSILANITSVLSGKIKLEGNLVKAVFEVDKWFWHFWERTEQTQENILRSKYR
jgi:hypothetical protein